jgi:KDO2-lipid IV(A) lauroyltransferase
MNAPPFQWQFLAPQYWPTWLGIGLFRALCALPLPWALTLGEGLGWLLGQVIRTRRHVVRTNLKLCFPHLDETTRERLVDEHFKAVGAGLFEAGYAWWASDAQLRRYGEVAGLEHLEAAVADGHGVLLLTGHFTTLELGARYLRLFGPRFHAMYRPLNNGVVDYFMHRWREDRAGLPSLPRDDLRALVRALRDGNGIWYAPDQTLDFRHSVFVPFFGVPALTITATSRLARMGRARVVPFFPARDGRRYKVTVLPALENFPGDDDTADAARINQVIEQGIALAPAQYFWIHRRFKWRPQGEKDVYDGA